MSSDVLVRTVDPAAGLRIIAAVTTDLAREAARRHEAVGLTACALARGLTASALLATLTKGGERVTVQIQCEGPLGGITIDAAIDTDRVGLLRGYLVHARAVTMPCVGRGRVVEVLGRDGVVNVIRDIGLTERYQGQVPLLTGEVDEDIENYLRASEQVPSALGCDVWMPDGVTIAASAGVLVQALPGADSDSVRPSQHTLRTGAVYEYLRTGGTSARELAEAAYGAPLEFLGEQPLEFRCRCSPDRVEEMLMLLTTVDLDEMIAEGRDASVTCNFCNAHYAIDAAALERVRAALAHGPRGNN